MAARVSNKGTVTVTMASRFAALVLLALVYGAGLTAGRDHCMQHPALYPNLKP